MKETNLSIFIRAAIIVMATIPQISIAKDIADNPIHLPNDGDRLHPNVSFSQSSIPDIDEEKRTVTFVPELFAPMDGADVSVYIDNDTLSYIQFATKHIFRIDSDTLSLLGYENRASGLRIDNPTRTVAIMTGESAPISGEWTARQILYGRDFLKKAKGMSRSVGESGWTLISEPDTLRNVSYIRWDIDMAYFDYDSITACMPDSIASESVSDLRLPVGEMAGERLLLRREMWFVETARYPVLQRSLSCRMKDDGDGRRDTIPVSCLAMHYPPDFQYSDTGGEPLLRAAGHNPCDNLTDQYPYNDDRTGSLQVSEATVAGNTVNVTISGTAKDEAVFLSLYTDSGIRLSEPVPVTAGYVPKAHSLPIPENISGILIIMIESDSGRISRKVTI